MADDPHEARRILLDFITAAETHIVERRATGESYLCPTEDCTCINDAQKALSSRKRTLRSINIT